MTLCPNPKYHSPRLQQKRKKLTIENENTEMNKELEWIRLNCERKTLDN
jgi:hypothetical protein